MKNRKRISILAVTIIILGLLFIWSSGLMGLWIKGMPHIVSDLNKYQIEKGHTIDDEYSLIVDLNNLENNIGKDLYNDGTHRIYVTLIRTSDHPGVYDIFFRSSGPYALSGASLVSGLQHAMRNESDFTTEMSAQMTTEIDGKIYENHPSATSGVNFRDGDEFGFYIGPTDVSESDVKMLEKEESMKITVSNLYQNIWSKK